MFSLGFHCDFVVHGDSRWQNAQLMYTDLFLTNRSSQVHFVDLALPKTPILIRLGLQVSR